MDAFAVSVCKGLGMHRVNYAHALVIALFFGVFQGLMPVIGWLVGSAFAVYVTAVDHWIAFALLAFVGGKMLWDAFHDEGEEEDDETSTQRLDLRELFMLAIATSIDALAVGISFSFLQIDIVAAALIIGCTTFVLSLVGALAYSASVLYGVSMTTEMMENYLATDRAEATAYFSLKTVLTFLAAFAPGLVIALAADFKEWFVKPFVRRTLATAAFCTGFLAVGAALLLTQMQTLASTVRNNRDLRYDLAPVSPLVALYKATLGDKTSKVRGPRTVVDTKPVLTAAYAERKDPMLFVVVVGETTRAANWQASGYNRTTLPELSKITDVVEMPVYRCPVC